MRQAQRLLLHNAFGTFDPGPIDGVYGERTAAAVRRAKYWLGYPEQQIDEIASPDLVAMLAGGVAQPPSFKAMRTRAGCGGPQDAGLWDSAYDVAISNVGERESPPGRAGSSAPTGTACRRRGARSSCRGASPGPGRRRSGRRPLRVRRRTCCGTPSAATTSSRSPAGRSRATCRCSTWTATASPTTSGCSTTGRRGRDPLLTIEGNVTPSGEPNGGRMPSSSAARPALAFVHVRG